MTSLSLSALVEKLTPEAKGSLEQAAALASSRTHYSIEIAHWLLTMIQGAGSFELEMYRSFSVDLAKLQSDVQLQLEKFKTGCQTVPGLSSHTVTILQNAWMTATIAFEAQKIAPIHLLHAFLSDDTLFAFSSSFSPELEKIDPDALLQFSRNYVKSPQAEAANRKVSTQALEQFTIDLTEQARAGEIDPVIGRDDEIRLMTDILLRRRQNNPILTGEAGVGKTAVVEGLALKIASGDVPPALKNVQIKSLDLALLQAGAGMKGEFENRLKNVVKEVKESPVPIILFIDEAHGLIGGGAQAGQGDAANILKPALARGELRTIAATTWAEYKKYVEKDAALTRRFQVVKIEEPTAELAVEMLRGLLNVMEHHHGVHITAEALKAAVTLSDRYISGRQLPDKAVSVLDTACSRVALSQNAVPGALDQKRKQRQMAENQLNQLLNEQSFGQSHHQLIGELEVKISALHDDIAQLESVWQRENEAVSAAKALRAEILQQPSAEKAQQLVSIEKELAENPTPLVFSHVNEALVAEIIADWTGIPLGKLKNDEVKAILNLQHHLCERVVGQDHALAKMAEVIKTARAQLNDESKPNGIFFLVGPSGVGKTESALAIAEQVYGSEENITVINMSEFKEEHKVSLLLGSPPGYVGYGEGGILTEAVRRKPYSVILLDEMEKAHPGVQDIFYQVFDKGMIKDGEGRDIDFKNTIVIMTSNSGTDTTMELFQDPELAPDADTLKEALRDDLLKDFKPAFLGRVNVIPYLPLSRDVLIKIADLKISKIRKRIENNYKAETEICAKLIGSIVDNCNESGSGARALQTVIENRLLPKISDAILNAVLNDTPVDKVVIQGELGDLLVSIQ
ncbi:type VI secretion system ATPase TssH [Vibrio navarrensis]|uniref:type VI secretion system ATPase TssH n=1 Tax=Vibrio navarrensis TaxID=29495 RepID=UPI001869FC3C|nr:type VI secretion system ATPase TssH [Vibrio navarrensis]MBE4598990.1 ClpV1 family T6SS ATPase [Vibrio navarrensis]